VSTRTPESGATAAETAAFNNPASEERKAYTNQVQSQSKKRLMVPILTAEQKQALNSAIAGNQTQQLIVQHLDAQAGTPPTPNSQQLQLRS
jgi:hypothetical protein